MNTYHKTNPDIRAEIINKHFNKKVSQVELAKEYRLCRQMIQRICSKHGVSPLKKQYILDDEKIKEMYIVKKMSVKAIADYFNLNVDPIKLRLKLMNVEKRPKSNRYIWAKEIPHYWLKIKIWVAKVIDRDKMLCKMCGGENMYKNLLEAHHITPVRDIQNPEMLFDIGNGITLCRKCHMKIHFKEHEYKETFLQLIRTAGSV